MSPDFVKTPMCAFQTEYALSLSPGAANKKLLPVMYRNCDVPAGLKHIAGLYYTRDELKVSSLSQYRHAGSESNMRIHFCVPASIAEHPGFSLAV